MLEPTTKAPLNTINRILNYMLSTLFDPHIIIYETPRRFLVPKFTMYDGMTIEARQTDLVGDELE